MQSDGGTYGFIEGPDGRICGIWLRDPRQASEREFLRMVILEKGDALPKEAWESVYKGNYRTVPATMPDGAQGCFVLFPWAPQVANPGKPIPHRPSQSASDSLTTGAASGTDPSSAGIARKKWWPATALQPTAPLNRTLGRLSFVRDCRDTGVACRMMPMLKADRREINLDCLFACSQS